MSKNGKPSPRNAGQTNSAGFIYTEYEDANKPIAINNAMNMKNVLIKVPCLLFFACFK